MPKADWPLTTQLRTLANHETNFRIAHLAKLSRAKRVSLATLLTLAGVVGMEVAHFSTGTSAALQASRFAIPGAIALLFFESWTERAIAFVLLTLVGFAGVATAIFLYLTSG
jgi:hypothetical protein